jgi:hypothetical protein
MFRYWRKADMAFALHMSASGSKGTSSVGHIIDLSSSLAFASDR